MLLAQILIEREEGKMDSKNKNILIGGLVAIVLVMAVGYAAFATQLNINGTASITSTWNVGFDTSKTGGTGVVDATTGTGGTTAPTGEVSYTNAQNASISADLTQPGDKVVFTLTIKNTGTLNATLATPVISSTDDDVDIQGLTATKGNIKFTVTSPASTSLVANTGTTTMTVTAEFVDNTVSSSAKETASINVLINATQATS